MAELPEEPLKGAGFTVRVEPMQVATLRYFDPAGSFARALTESVGVVLPAATRALESPDGELSLAWRSPTETLLFTRSAMRLAGLEERLSAEREGCLVNLTGALTVLLVTGERNADLLRRLGGARCVPSPGESRRARLADVPVLGFALREGETFLTVDRGYAPHLLGWLRETLLDFADA